MLPYSQHPSSCVHDSSKRGSQGTRIQINVILYDVRNDDGKPLCSNLRWYLFGNIFLTFLIKCYPLKSCQCVWILFPWNTTYCVCDGTVLRIGWKTCWSSCEFSWGQMVPWSWWNKKPVRVCDTMDYGINGFGAFSAYEHNFSKFISLLVISVMDSRYCFTIWLLLSISETLFYTQN